MRSRIYLDYNATTPVISDVCNAIADIVKTTGNPSSIHHEGAAAKRSLRKAKKQVALLVGCQEDQVIFTSGGTESNNTVLSPLMARMDAQQGDTKLFVGATDHISVLKGGRFAPQQIEIIPVNQSGQITPQSLSDFLEQQGLKQQSLEQQALEQQSLIEKDVLQNSQNSDAKSENKTQASYPFLVSIMYANNETGCLQDIQALASVVHEFGGLFHVDAVQAVGKVKIDFASLQADFMSVSAHKMGGILGAGAIIAQNPDLLLKDVLIRGGGQEKNRRGGTENLPALISFGIAAERAVQKLEIEIERLSALTALLEEGLKQLYEKVEIVSEGVDRLPNTVCFISEGIKAENMLMVFDLAGIAVSSGSACSSGRVTLSHVLKAMGYEDDLCASAIRVSLGWGSRKEDIDAFLVVYADIIARHKKYEKVA